MPNQYTAWTDAEDEMLKELAEEGCTLNEAAARLNAKFGTERTRNSTVSRAKRIGAKWLGRPPVQIKRPTTILKVEPPPPVVNLPAPKKEPPKKPVLKPIKSIFGDIVFEKRDGFAFLDLKLRHCRYPLGDVLDRAEMFCGEAIRPGSPYCDKHHAQCYVRPRSLYQKDQNETA